MTGTETSGSDSTGMDKKDATPANMIAPSRDRTVRVRAVIAANRSMI
jgi:hypothetical protein